MLEKSAIDLGKYGIETGESDVTYEEMEFIMKLNPSTQVLSINLKQGIMSSKHYTVEPPNIGHFESRAFVLFSEVVLCWEVHSFIAISRNYR